MPGTGVWAQLLGAEAGGREFQASLGDHQTLSKMKSQKGWGVAQWPGTWARSPVPKEPQTHTKQCRQEDKATTSTERPEGTATRHCTWGKRSFKDFRQTNGRNPSPAEILKEVLPGEGKRPPARWVWGKKGRTPEAQLQRKELAFPDEVLYNARSAKHARKHSHALESL